MQIDEGLEPTGWETRVTNSAAPSSVLDVVWTGSAYAVLISWNGASFGILRRGASDNPTFIPVSSSGVVGASSVVINEQAMDPDLVWNGSEYLATFAWPFGPRLSFARLSASGAMRGRHVLTGATHPNVGFARIAWDGSSLVGAWHDERYGNQEVSLGRFAAACQ